ncbi:MAG: TonB-dependent siderophore receptor [Bordetella sp.]|nr:TonB-dependent siderophore receptor [Bordetella sp.]
MSRSPLRCPAPLALAVALAVAGVAAHAQGSAAELSGAPVSFSLAAQPLSQALSSWALQTGAQLIVQPALVAGKTAPAVSGTLTPGQALDRLLAGSGLTAGREGNAVVIKAAAPAGEAATLAPVTVTAAASGPDAPTESTGSYTSDAPSTSATRLPLTLRETPQSVSIITRQRMEDQNLTSLDDVMAETPGISRSQTGVADVGYVFYYSRGFQINNYQLDGMITSSNAMQGFTGLGARDMAIYDSVTVVRGATGLLTGAGDPSASINLVRKRPTRDFQGYASVQASRWNTYRGEVDISTPLDSEGRVRGRLVAAQEDGASWMPYVKSRKATLYGVVEADLGSGTVVRGGLEYFRLHTRGSGVHGFNYLDTAGVPTRFTGYDNPWVRQGYSEQDRTTLFADLEHRFANGWQARLSASRTRVDSDRLFGVAAQDIQARTNATRGSVGRSILTPSQSALDGSITGPYTLFGRRHELVAGFNYYRLSRDDPNFPSLNFAIPNIYQWDGSVAYSALPTGDRNTQVTRQLGAYLATRLKPTDALSVIAGARVSNYRNETRSTLQAGQAGSSTQHENGVVTPYLGVVYDFTPEWSGYASYTTIFNPQSNQTATGETLSPERGKSYEIGVKGELFDGALNASVAAFRTLKDNLAVADGNRLTPDGGQAYVGANDTTSQGWELEVNGQLRPGWQIAAGYTHVVTRDSKGARLNTQWVPEHQLKLFTSYRLGGDWSGLTLGGGVIWQSRVWAASSSYNAAQLAGYQQGSRALFSLMARYQITPRLDLALNLENVFDKRYRVNVTQHIIGTPRNLTATLKYRF